MELKKWNVEITETLQKVVSVEASSADEALDKVMEDYRNELIVLSPEDFVDCDFNLTYDEEAALYEPVLDEDEII